MMPLTILYNNYIDPPKNGRRKEPVEHIVDLRTKWGRNNCSLTFVIRCGHD